MRDWLAVRRYERRLRAAELGELERVFTAEFGRLSASQLDRMFEGILRRSARPSMGGPWAPIGIPGTVSGSFALFAMSAGYGVVFVWGGEPPREAPQNLGRTMA